MRHVQSLPAKAIFSAVFCNVLFGSAFPMIKLGYTTFGITDDIFMKLLFAGIRFFLSGIMVFLIAALKNHKLPTISHGNLGNVCAVAFFYTFMQYIFFYIGLSNTSGASGSIINSVSAFLAVLLAHFIYPDDKMTVKKLFGTIVGFLGVLFATLANDKMGHFSFLGEGFIFLASLFFVIGSMLNKRASQKTDPFTITAYNLLLGGGMLLLSGMIGCNGFSRVSFAGILVLLYLSLVSAIGFTIWSNLLKSYPIGKISIYNFVIPVSGAILSGLVLKENIVRLEYLLALLLVCIGIIMVNVQKGTS